MLDSTGIRRAFSAYLDRLVDSLDSRSDIQGLVLAGSTANRSRVDEWSDHDFFVIARTPETAESLRQNLTWLPDADHIVIGVRDGQHGVAVMYRDGHVLEFAVFVPDELMLAHANDFEVAIDRGGIAATMRDVAARVKPPVEVSPQHHAQRFLLLLLIGVGRARRGETLSAGHLIRGLALTHLLAVHRAVVPGANDPRLDDLDMFRRLEMVHPDLAALLERALERDPERAARSLLYIAEKSGVTAWSLWPADAAHSVRQRLGWADSPPA